MPEGRGIFPNLSVRENLVATARPRRSGTTQGWMLEQVLELFPVLGPRLHNAGNQLSGGEQQMLAVGRALMTTPTCSFWTRPPKALLHWCDRTFGPALNA